MLRRHSPTKFNRRNSPPRKNTQRSLSPLPRDFISMAERGRKANKSRWNEPINSSKKMQSRSRSRERMLRDDDDNNRDHRRYKDVRKSRFEDHRPKDLYRSEIVNDNKQQYKRDAGLHNYNIVDRGNEGRFVDRSRNNFDDMHGGLILDPSSINFDIYQEGERLPEPPHPPHIESFVRQSEKSENPEERIKRLEKLVEKLVEGNVKTARDTSSHSRISKNVRELIPSNTKFTTSMWLNEIQEERMKRGFDEKTTIQFTQDKMTGIMKSWFKSVSSYAFTWPELKLLITKTFPDNVDFAATLKLLVSRDKTSEETITQYYFSKLYLCEACKITGEDTVSCIIDGLTNPFMKQDIKSHKFLTPEALYLDYLAKFPDNEIPVKIDREVVPYHDDFETVSFEETSFPPLSPQKKKKLLEKPRCLTCKKLGHTTLGCRHAPICYNCRKKGHIAAKCYATPVMLVSSSEQEILPICECRINGILYDGILDTGSGPVIIQRRVLEELMLEYKPSKQILKAFGGKLVKSIGEVIISVEVDDVKRLVKALVVADNVQGFPVIIGQSYLSQQVGALIFDEKMRVFDLPNDLRMKLSNNSYE